MHSRLFDDSDSASTFTELEELAELHVSSDDFSPFSSKVHALLFMLIHSPRPIVSSKNIEFRLSSVI